MALTCQSPESKFNQLFTAPDWLLAGRCLPSVQSPGTGTWHISSQEQPLRQCQGGGHWGPVLGQLLAFQARGKGHRQELLQVGVSKDGAPQAVRKAQAGAQLTARGSGMRGGQGDIMPGGSSREENEK